MLTIDIETLPIVDFAPLLPRPVGIAIRDEKGNSTYHAFGHQSNNTCSWYEAAELVRSIWDKEFLGHNILSFDVPVLQHWFNLPPRDPLLTQDSLFLSFLNDPHAPQLGLKYLAENWCGIPPDDQQVMIDWIMRNTECKSRKKAGAHIWEVPGDIAGRYAISDVTMTHALYEYLAPKVLPTMQEPYDRERRLAPVLVQMQNVGVRVDLERLKVDTVLATQNLHALDAEVRRKLNTPDLSLDSDASVVAALQANGYSNFLTTPTGKLSAAKDSLDSALADDPELRELLKQRATFATLVGTFMQPWVEIAEANGGRIHASYNAIRNAEGFGTRTGRLSSSKPNFQNIPSSRLGAEYPVMRSYLLPDDGCVWVTADLRSQEPRLTGHFEDDALCRAFKENPELDQYLWIAELCGITRTQAKVVFLGIVYAMGAKTMSEGLGCSEEEAGRLRTIIRSTLPGVTQLDYDCKRRFQLGLPIKTLGGRVAHCEPPKNGRRFEYKSLNYLIQGSAADQTKAMMVYVSDRLLPGERIVNTVHDEVSVCCPEERVEAVAALLLEGANALPCDVPMLISWGYGKNFAEAGK